MEYRVVFAETPSRLEARVQRLIQHGWEPIGGTSAVPREQKLFMLFQAMIRFSRHIPEEDQKEEEG